VQILAATTATLLFVTNLWAWNGNEHITIGSEAYYLACKSVLKNHEAATGEIANRKELACRAIALPVSDGAFGLREGYAYDALAGEWSALAADHTRSADELTQVALGDVVADYRLFTMMAVSNYRHFHPASVTSWRAEHLKSLQAAAAAARSAGIERIEGFEKALAIQAFAQHYLQDSFSAGHMGFNRVASSNAAALAYHNAASRTGRCVENLNGVAWFTYGDDHLNDSDEGKQHVITAAELSMLDFLETFVTGDASETRWQNVWLELPSHIKDDLPTAGAKCSGPSTFRSLRSVSQPAEAAVTMDIMLASDASLYRPAMQGLLVGASRDFIYTIPLGYRVIQNRIYGLVGATTKQLGPRAILADFGYLWHVGTTNRGVLTHEVGFGEHLYWATRGGYRSASLRGLYAINIEAGRIYLRFQAGAAYSVGRWGPHLSTGIGWVHRSGK
jgi:hypothetical protein